MQHIRVPFSSARLLHLLLVVYCVVLTVSGSGDGIDCSEGGVDPLPLSPCNSTGGVLLSSLGLCGGGCVTDWTYCYSKTNSTVPVTFALWREVNGLLERVEGSSYEMKMKRLPAEQWFVCEDIPVECGVPILEGDLVGVVIGEGTSVCMLGEMDDGVVMVGGWEEGREGRLTKASLQNVTGQALLVSALAGDCSTATAEEMCLETTTSLSPNLPPTTTNPGLNDSSEEGLQLWVIILCSCLGLIIVLLLSVICFLICFTCRQRRSMMTSPLHTVLHNGHRKYSGNSELDVEMHILNTTSSNSTSLSPTPLVNTVSSSLSPTHLVNTVSSSLSPTPLVNTTSSSLSPTPLVNTTSSSLSPTPLANTSLPRVTDTQLNGHISIGVQDEQPVTITSFSSQKMKKPPVKPKPHNLTSYKATPPRSPPSTSDLLRPLNEISAPPHHVMPPNEDSDPPHHAMPPNEDSDPSYPADPPHQTVPPNKDSAPPYCAVPPNEDSDLPHHPVPPNEDSDLPHHGGLPKSFSEDVFVQHPPGKRPNILPPRSPHRVQGSRRSTGSLPDIFTPSVDEDDYTLPTHNPLPCRIHSRPQPYLKPHATIYSYAYTHIGQGWLRTLSQRGVFPPQREAATPDIKLRSQSSRTSPYDAHSRDSSDDGEIFVDKYWQEQAIASGNSVPPDTVASGNSVPPDTVASGNTVPPDTVASGNTVPSDTVASGNSVSPDTVASGNTVPPDTVASGNSVPPDTKGTLCSTSSSPATISHTSLEPISRLMSTGSDGYMNEDEYPRPSAVPPLRYTPLQPTLREECPTYQVPGESHTSSDDLHDPSELSDPSDLADPSTDYDHLFLTDNSHNPMLL